VAAGGGEVTNSWGGAEFSGETSFDTHFAGANVVYFASTGDDPGVEYPSTSSKVVAAGGTSLSRNLDATFSYRLDTSWVDGGGGPSLFVATPSYQSAPESAGRIGSFRLQRQLRQRGGHLVVYYRRDQCLLAGAGRHRQ
jgi:subtilase family serine protease